MKGTGRAALGLLLGGMALTCGCRSTLHHGLSEEEANEALVLLERADIDADKERDAESRGWALEVPRAERARAWEVLRQAGLPRRPSASFAALYEDAGLLPDPQSARVRLQAATAGELERSLLLLPGVIGARVHVVLPDPPSMAGTSSTAPRASALLRVERGARIDAQAAAALVSGGVPGLPPEQVRVAVVEAPPPPPAVEVALVAFGPVKVPTDAAGPLRWLFGLLAGLLGLESVALVWAVRRLRTLRARGVQAPDAP